jgi:hypothetical protein
MRQRISWYVLCGYCGAALIRSPEKTTEMANPIRKTRLHPITRHLRANFRRGASSDARRQLVFFGLIRTGRGKSLFLQEVGALAPT